MAIERTFTMVKPDGTARQLTGEIVRRFADAGLKLVGLRMVQPDGWDAREFYAEHKGKDFYDGLVEYMTSGPVVACVLEGENAVKALRSLAGATNPAKADKGTIRGDFGLELPKNTIHGSDSPASAEREISFFFKPSDLVK